jgi:hypothetical protein
VPLLETRPRTPLTLVEDLSEVIDDVRDILTDIGLRPARVFVLHYRWSGGERYRGAPELVETLELTPRPIVADENDLKADVDRRGAIALGLVHLREISPRYTETDLDILRRAIPADEEVLVEIVHDGRDGRNPQRRGYRPEGKPVRDAASYEWRLELRAIVDARTIDGYRRGWARE